jgi:hypothetical protein
VPGFSQLFFSLGLDCANYASVQEGTRGLFIDASQTESSSSGGGQSSPVSWETVTDESTERDYSSLEPFGLEMKIPHPM